MRSGERQWSRGLEYRATGRITLPVPERSALHTVRRGESALAHVLAWYDDLDVQLLQAAEATPLPPEPDWAWINDWLHRSYPAFWAA